MDYNPLWNAAHSELRHTDIYTVSSSTVADMLGADRISRQELEADLRARLPNAIQFEFTGVQGEYVWTMVFRRND